VTVVGVVADEKQDGLASPVQPEVYSPFARNATNDMTFVVRSYGPPETLTGLARQVVHGVDKDLVLTNVNTLNDIVYGSMKNERFRTTLVAGFGNGALSPAQYRFSRSSDYIQRASSDACSTRPRGGIGSDVVAQPPRKISIRACRRRQSTLISSLGSFCQPRK
jgi:hypothetical protein